MMTDVSDSQDVKKVAPDTTTPKAEGEEEFQAPNDEEAPLPEAARPEETEVAVAKGAAEQQQPWWKTKKFLIGSAVVLLLIVIVAVVLSVTLTNNDETTTTTATWTQLGDDIHAEAPGDLFARSAISLSADGRTIAVGSHHNDGGGWNSGHVRVHRLQGQSWVQVGEDIDGKATNEGAGRSVSLSADGNTVAIGAWGNSAYGNEVGRARVYSLIDERWTQVGQDMNGEDADDQFGIAVSLSGDGQFLAVGANQFQYFNDIGPGYARVFQSVGGSWVQLGEDIVGAADGDQFGVSVSLSDDGMTVAVGAAKNDGALPVSGHVGVYGFQGGKWEKRGSYIDGEDVFDESGSSVSLSADGWTVAVGADGNDNLSGVNAGHARVHRLMLGDWMQIGQDINGKESADHFGFSVSLSAAGDLLAVGGPQPGANNTAKLGYAQVFQLVGADWIQLGQDIVGEAPDVEYGSVVALSADGSTVAVGGQSGLSGQDSGYARVYTLVEE